MFKLPIDQLSKYRLYTLYQTGFRPRTILDIGAYKGTWSREIKQIFPDSEVYMIEGNPECEPDLIKTGYPYTISMLSNYVKTADYYIHKSEDNDQSNQTDQSGNSVYREQTDAYQDGKCIKNQVTCDTLFNVVRTRNISDIDFIKIDVQGSEKDVINGGLIVVRNAKVVLLELQLVEYNQGAPLIAEMIAYMECIGFKLFDIIELHYTPGHVLLQIDVLFGRKDFIDQPDKDGKKLYS